MAQTGVFDELSSRINKGKRPDSGIHNSVELNADEIKAEEKDIEKARIPPEEMHDSGQESADQMDSSVTGSSKKKPGFLKSFKKIFKKKKGPSNTPNKSTKKKNEDFTIQEHYRAHSLSETNILSSVDNTNSDAGLKRFNTDASGLSPKRPTKPIRNIEKKGTNDEKVTERKTSLKDAQQYIRSSLRKLKGGNKKNDVTAESTDIEEFEIDNDASVLSQNSSFGHASFNDEFFSKSLAVDDKLNMSASNVPVKLGDITPTSPEIENALAKDRIRVAPQNRRKPSRYRVNAPPKPARTASSFSFKEDLSLSKIDEDKDNFTSVSRHSSNVSRHDSARDSYSSYIKSDSEGTHRSSFDSTTQSTRSNDHIPRALLNKHSFSSGDELEKPRSIAQRSFSTNSRENINRSKPPVKPPRSAHVSSSSLNNEENLGKKLSLSELKNQLFYTEAEKTKGKETQPFVEKKNDIVYDKKEEIRTSNEQIFNQKSLSFDDKRKSFFETTQPRDNKPHSLGDNRRSILSRSSTEASDDDKRSSVTELRQSLENLDNKRYSYGATQNSSVSSDTKRDSYKVTRNSSVSLDSKRDSYGASFGLSTSHTSLDSHTDKIEKQNLYKLPSLSKENKNDVFSSKEKLPSSNSKELVFQKSDEPSYGLTAFALTSPRQDRVEPTISSNMTRSKSYSEKLEKIKSAQPRPHAYHSKISNSKSVGYINEVGTKPSPLKEKPVISPRKLRRPSPEKPEKKENPAEFRRISLRKVPKMEDYMEMETEESKDKQHDISNTSSILDFVNNELVLDEPSPTKPNGFGQFELSHSVEVSSKTKVADAQGRGNETSDLKSGVAFKRSLINNVDLTSSKSTYEQTGAPVKTASEITGEQSQHKPASWKHFEEKKSVDEISSENVEFKRHSLKKIDRPNVDEPKSFSLPIKRASDVNEEREIDKPPRSLVKNRPTVHGISEKDFSFQSNDIKNRSKSLGSSDQKRLSEKAAAAGTENEDTNSSEPAWFKLARRKQKNEEVTDENVSQTSPKNSLQETRQIAIPPPLKAKPKISPRPVVSPKHEVTTKPAPLIAKKPSPAAPSIRTSRQFNANSDMAKDSCLVCGKTAYSIERIDVDKHVLHKGCAKCTECSRKLSIGGIFIRDKNVFCSHHK